jgi:tRNA-splicing ligase RtcB (3'-phosphate/5'-hydroxy nucleic acid ligase)
VTDDYIRAMNFALEFARANRAAMVKVFEEIGGGVLGASVLERIDIHHNYAQLEDHFGEDVWVHRKGATRAFKGELGVIPGSMGTTSYIVRGLGNLESFQSCSHGAGRKMGRGAFSRTHTVEECDREMEGIFFGGWGKGRKGQPDLSEAPGAYKDIDAVMAAQADLVKPVVALRPLGVMKG